MNFKYFSPDRTSFLPEKDRTSIIQFDRDSGNKHNWRCYHQHNTLNTPEFKADIDRTVNWLREQPDSPLRDAVRRLYEDEALYRSMASGSGSFSRMAETLPAAMIPPSTLAMVSSPAPGISWMR